MTNNKWTELVDYYYLNQRDDPSRTRVAYDTENMTLKTTHVTKQTRENYIFCRTDEGDDDACRLSCATEEPLVNPPGTCIPTLVRIKQLKVFQDIRQNSVIWSYELSKTWSSNNRSSVEHLQHMMEPRYEVEVELIDEHGTYMQGLTDQEVADSLLMKATMLLGETPDKCLTLEKLDSHKKKVKRKRLSST